MVIALETSIKCVAKAVEKYRKDTYKELKAYAFQYFGNQAIVFLYWSYYDLSKTKRIKLIELWAFLLPK